MATKLEFSRGDAIHHNFLLPAVNWSAGGKLFFAAKPAIDDDDSDTAAVIDQHWDDTAVSDTVIGGVAYKQYDCYFPPSATSEIDSGGADSQEYLGEFQYVPSSGLPQTYPANNQKIDAIVYFDVKRKVVP